MENKNILDRLKDIKVKREEQQKIDNPNNKELKIPDKPFLTDLKSFNISLLIASVFSIIFSLSIISVLDVSIGILILTTVFLGLFFFGNEYIKVKFLKKFFSEKENNYVNLTVGILCVIFSLTSLYGIYNSINRTEVILKKQQDDKNVVISSQKDSVINQIDSLRNVNYKLQNNITERLSKIAELIESKEVATRQRKEMQSLYERQNIMDNEKIDINKTKVNTLDTELSKLQSGNATKEIDAINNIKNNKILVVSILVCSFSFIVELVIIILSRYIAIQERKNNTRMEYWEKEKNEIIEKHQKEIDEYNKKIKEREEKEEKEFLKSSYVKNVIKHKRYLDNFYMIKQMGDKIKKEELQTVVNSDDKQDLPDFYQLCKTLGVIKGERKGTYVGLNRENAIKKLDNYYTEVYYKDQQSFKFEDDEF